MNLTEIALLMIVLALVATTDREREMLRVGVLVVAALSLILGAR